MARYAHTLLPISRMMKLIKNLRKFMKKRKRSQKQRGGQTSSMVPSTTSSMVPSTTSLMTPSTTSTRAATTSTRAATTSTRAATTTSKRTPTTSTRRATTSTLPVVIKTTMPPVTIYLTRASNGNIVFPMPTPSGLNVTTSGLNKISISGMSIPLKNVIVYGYSKASWLSASGRLNSGPTTILMSDASGNPIRSSTARSQPGAISMMKLPLTSVISKLNISGLEQGNFSNFNVGGDKLNGGSNIKIELYF